MTFKYLAGYSATVTEQVQHLMDNGKLTALLLKKYPNSHHISTDKTLYSYTIALKNQFLRQSQPLSKVIYDDKIDILYQALGLHTFISRVQGGHLKAKHEIRISSVFKSAAPEFLKMIVVHELAHLREKTHNKAFYKLCEHMESEYHQLEFDFRLYLTHLDLLGPLY